ncbi:MAG TPA: FAD-dependent oxidoreductase, partial [Blastocatellia bacterium]|nr:FAD-dependent oxidoreductase [Blastocatellia bacterium]
MRHLFFIHSLSFVNIRVHSWLKFLFLKSVAVLLLAPAVFGQAKKFDVVVYGGTAGGVMTAVSAAREGLTVAVVEPSKHLGGM